MSALIAMSGRKRQSWHYRSFRLPKAEPMKEVNARLARHRSDGGRAATAPRLAKAASPSSVPPTHSYVLRRALLGADVRRDHSVRMSAPTLSPATESGVESAPDGISALVAKVLDQLSLSAWLPAGLLAATLSLLLQFRSQGSADLDQALEAISQGWLAVLLLAAPVLVLGTLTTQAFSFGAIRALEGYWMRRRPARWLRGGMVRFQVWRWEGLKKRKKRYARVAFDNAEARFTGIPSEVVMALRAEAHELAPITLNDPGHRVLFDRLDWRSACDPWDLARFDDTREAVKEYPSRFRMLPTRLGNILRATEDHLVAVTGEDLVTFALRRRTRLEPRAQRQHDQFRTRLDMYCTLVFVSLGIAALSMMLVIGEAQLLVPFMFIAAGFIVLALVAYQAALGSARGYCTILRLMATV
jgi:hypothetical protein